MDHVVDEEAERMERREQELLDQHYRTPPLFDSNS
jgi:ssRNA-specific RNase YbeY (16S rRNA maturation enzyme)